MGWKRSKHDLGGKLIELQTFVGDKFACAVGQQHQRLWDG